MCAPPLQSPYGNCASSAIGDGTTAAVVVADNSAPSSIASTADPLAPEALGGIAVAAVVVAAVLIAAVFVLRRRRATQRRNARLPPTVLALAEDIEISVPVVAIESEGVGPRPAASA